VDADILLATSRERGIDLSDPRVVRELRRMHGAADKAGEAAQDARTGGGADGSGEGDGGEEFVDVSGVGARRRNRDASGAAGGGGEQGASSGDGIEDASDKPAGGKRDVVQELEEVLEEVDELEAEDLVQVLQLMRTHTVKHAPALTSELLQRDANLDAATVPLEDLRSRVRSRITEVIDAERAVRAQRARNINLAKWALIALIFVAVAARVYWLLWGPGSLERQVDERRMRSALEGLPRSGAAAAEVANYLQSLGEGGRDEL